MCHACLWSWLREAPALAGCAHSVPKKSRLSFPDQSCACGVPGQRRGIFGVRLSAACALHFRETPRAWTSVSPPSRAVASWECLRHLQNVEATVEDAGRSSVQLEHRPTLTKSECREIPSTFGRCPNTPRWSCCAPSYGIALAERASA